MGLLKSLCGGTSKIWAGLYNGTTTELAKQSTVSSLSSEVSSLKDSVSEGKSLIASALTDKGISTSSTATFQTMANGIRNIRQDVIDTFYKYHTSEQKYNTFISKWSVPNYTDIETTSNSFINYTYNDDGFIMEMYKWDLVNEQLTNIRLTIIKFTKSDPVHPEGKLVIDNDDFGRNGRRMLAPLPGTDYLQYIWLDNLYYSSNNGTVRVTFSIDGQASNNKYHGTHIMYI